jgi:predicted nucleotidyltransferase
MMFDYIDIVKQIVLKHVPTDAFAIFLFGSRAAGNAKPLSDIDIGILGTEPLPMIVKAHLDAEFIKKICLNWFIKTSRRTCWPLNGY